MVKDCAVTDTAQYINYKEGKMKKHLLKLILLCCIGILALSITACVPATEQYKLDFIVDGEVYHSRTTNGASRINPPIDPEKTGFVFDGWYFDEEFTEKYTADYMITNPIKKDTKLYAKWIADEFHTCEAGDWICDIKATCKDEGREYRSCIYCKREMDSRAIPVSDKHTTTETYNKQVNVVPATCKEKGSFENVTFCCLCNREIERVPGTLDKDNNAHKIDEKTYTLTKNGDSFTFTGKCTECGVTVRVANPIVTTNVTTSPTCTEEGEAVYTYAAFGSEFTLTETLAPTGHSLAGEYIDLSKIYNEIDSPKILDKVVIYSEYEDALCGEVVLASFDCEACDAWPDLEVKMPHKGGTWRTVTEATCYTDGEQIIDKCTACGAENLSRKIKATGRHDYVNGSYSLVKEGNVFNVVTPCAEKGCPHYRMVISDVQVKTEEIISKSCDTPDIVRYTYKDSTITVSLDIVIADGHFLNGVRASTFEITDHNLNLQFNFPVFSHTVPNILGFEDDSFVCGDEPVIAYYICETCGSKEDPSMVPIYVYRDHSWDAGTVTKSPTCQAEGNMHYTCTEPGCNGTKDVAIPIVPCNNKWSLTINADSLFVLTGKCTYCEELTVITGVSATLDNSKTKAPTCSEEGSMTYSYTMEDGTTVEVTVSLSKAEHSIKGTTVDKLMKDGFFNYSLVLSGDITLILADGETDSLCEREYIGKYTCSECKEVVNAKVYKAHKLVTATTDEPSCVEPGKEITSCEYCDYELEGELSPLGHDFDAQLTDVNGVFELVATCKVCGTKEKHENIVPTSLKVLTKATCCQVGVVEVKFVDSNGKDRTFVANTAKGNHYLNGVDYTTLINGGGISSLVDNLIFTSTGIDGDTVDGKFICEECGKFVRVQVIIKKED